MTRTIVLVAALLATGRAAAQNAEAETLFAEGERLEAAGKTDEACEAFEASNRIERRAGTMIRIGQCRERQDRIASAWSAYKDSLTRVQDPAKKQLAEARIAELEPKLSYLTVHVPARVEGLVIKRDGVILDPFLWDRAAPIDGGAHVITGEAFGHAPWNTTIDVAPAGANASVSVARLEPLPEVVVTASADEPEPPTPPGMFTTRRKIAIGVAGVGVVSLGAGVVLALDARSKRDRALELCPDPARCGAAAQAQDIHDRARSRALVANIAFGAATAAIAAAAVLWLTGAPAEVSVAAHAGHGEAGASIGWRF